MRWLLLITVVCLSLTGALAGQQPSLDLETQDLLTRLSHQPELMNLDYLQFFIGRPENERSQRGSATRNYYWYNTRRQLKYDLGQQGKELGQVEESIFTVHFPDSTISFDDVRRLYGEGTRQFYEYHGQPAMLYSFVPDTTLVFISPQSTFRVNQAKVVYRGGPLAMPAAADLKTAEDHMLARVKDFAGHERWDEMVPVLLERLKQNPQDGEAHYQLGRAYAKTGHIHEAILQYKAALSTVPPQAQEPAKPASLSSEPPALQSLSNPASGDAGQADSQESLRKRCLDGLRELRVLPAQPTTKSQQIERRKKFKIVHKGQRIRVSGTETIKHDPPRQAAEQ